MCNIPQSLWETYVYYTSICGIISVITLCLYSYLYLSDQRIQLLFLLKKNIHKTGKNILYPLIEFAITGKVLGNTLNLQSKEVFLYGKYGIQVFPALREGIITQIIGLDILKKHPKIVSVFNKYSLGDSIFQTHNVNQRFCEIDVVCDSLDDVKETVSYIYDTLHVLDENGDDMIITRKDIKSFLEYEK